MHVRDPLGHPSRGWLISSRALLVSLALAVTLSLVVVPRAQAISLLELSVVLNIIKNTIEPLCGAEVPSEEGVAALRQLLSVHASEVNVVVGTAGPDTLVGTPGTDFIIGFGGNDIISGLGGDDFICGGPGDDILIGGPGDDILIAAPGNDRAFPDELPLPQTAADCNADGWQRYAIFKNQGDCVSFVATGGRNPAAGP